MKFVIEYPHDPDEQGVIARLIKDIFTSEMDQGQYDGRFIISESPFTVLAPGNVPEWEDESGTDYQSRLEDLYGFDAVESIAMYKYEFNLPGKPFTCWGVWTDEGGCSGMFGQSYGEAEIKVLFC